MIHIIPCSTDSIGMGDRANGFSGSVGIITTTLPEEACVMCDAGCCVQVYRYDAADDEAIVVHGTLGDC